MKTNEQYAYLKTMGIDVWLTRDAEQPSEHPLETDWEVLEKKVAACTLCELHQGRTQTVFGVGNKQADLLIVGEAPGANEDKQGKPFVGRAGQLLTSMLLAIGLNREDIFIANVLKCRPPQNRDPKPFEVNACTAYLERQVELLQPKLILAVGRIAAHFLLKTDRPMGKLRGQRYQFRNTGIPLIVSYHPAYLLRSPLEKAKAYDDLLLVQKALDLS